MAEVLGSTDKDSLMLLFLAEVLGSTDENCDVVLNGVNALNGANALNDIDDDPGFDLVKGIVEVNFVAIEARIPGCRN